ncbi:MAG: hypothetical protein WCJ70_05010 [bacterium]
MIQIIKDTFYTTRGSKSKILALFCAGTHCGQTPFLIYQKDDYPGLMKRLYVDRCIAPRIEPETYLTCPTCKQKLGLLYTYEKENRIAYKLFAFEVQKKVISPKAAERLISSLGWNVNPHKQILGGQESL